MAGLFFCLASDTVQGFYFALLQYSPIQAFTACFVQSMQLYSPRRKAVHRALQGFFRLFAAFYRYYYICVYPAILHHLRHAGAHTRARTLYRPAQPPYYNKVYKGAPPVMDPCQIVQCTTDYTSPAHLLSGQRLHLHRVSPAACNLAPVSSQGAPGQSVTFHPVGQSGKGAAGGAEPLAALAASLFGLSPDS